MARTENKKEIEKPSLKQYLIGFGLIILIFSVFYYFKTKKEVKPTTSPSPEEILVQENGMVKKAGDGSQQELSEEKTKETKAEIEAILSPLEVESAELFSVDDNKAVGLVKRAYSDGKFYLKAVVDNLELPQKGYYYEGWLENNQANLLSVGRMEIGANKGEIYYLTSQDQTAYKKFKLSLEPEDGNPEINRIIITGEFK